MARRPAKGGKGGAARRPSAGNKGASSRKTAPKEITPATKVVFIVVALAVALGLAFQLWSSTPRPAAPVGTYVSVRQDLAPETNSLPGAGRAATPALVELLTRVRTGLPTSAPGFAGAYNVTEYGLLGVLLVLTMGAIVLLVGADTHWVYLALVLADVAISKPLTWVPPPPAPMFVWLRFTDYPSLLTTTVVFGLAGMYYLRGPEVAGSPRTTGLWLGGVAVAAALAAFVRETVLMCLVLAGSIAVLEAVRFALLAAKHQRSAKQRLDARGLLELALHHPIARAVGASVAILVGMGLGKLAVYAIFPELLKLKWQVLPGATSGGLMQDAAWYRPRNIARTAEIEAQLWSQYGLFMVTALLAPLLVRTPKARFLAIAVVVTFAAHFGSYYLFGGLIDEFYGIGVLIAGLCVPLALALAEGFPRPWGRWSPSG